MTLGRDLGKPYGAILALLVDCEPATHGRPQILEHRGATYRQLAAIAYQVGMSKPKRQRWNRVAEAVPLSQRHAAHMLSKLKVAA